MQAAAGPIAYRHIETEKVKQARLRFPPSPPPRATHFPAFEKVRGRPAGASLRDKPVHSTTIGTLASIVSGEMDRATEWNTVAQLSKLLIQQMTQTSLPTLNASKFEASRSLPEVDFLASSAVSDKWVKPLEHAISLSNSELSSKKRLSFQEFPFSSA